MDDAGTLRHLIPGKTAGRLLILLLILAATAVQAEPLRVLTQNMNRFFDDVDDGNQEKILPGKRFRQRVRAAARKFGDHFELPHIIALQEVENLNVLAQIAAEIHDRYDLRYRPVLIPGQDPSGINLAYLLRHGVAIREVDQLFANRTYGDEGH